MLTHGVWFTVGCQLATCNGGNLSSQRHLSRPNLSLSRKPLPSAASILQGQARREPSNKSRLPPVPVQQGPPCSQPRPTAWELAALKVCCPRWCSRPLPPHSPQHGPVTLAIWGISPAGPRGGICSTRVLDHSPLKKAVGTKVQSKSIKK